MDDALLVSGFAYRPSAIDVNEDRDRFVEHRAPMDIVGMA